VTALIHQAHPGIKNLLTMTPDLNYKDIDIWCPRINNFTPGLAEELAAHGKELWTYVAGPTRPYPNLNLDVRAVDYRILPWLCWKFKIKGLLYWSVNWWVKVNPWESAMTFTNQNGNGCLYYPGKAGPVGSIRLEVLRDGLEDYEFFYLLAENTRRLREADTTGKSSGLIEECQAALELTDEVGSLPAYYTSSSQVIYQKREKIAGLLEETARALTILNHKEPF